MRVTEYRRTQSRYTDGSIGCTVTGGVMDSRPSSSAWAAQPVRASVVESRRLTPQTHGIAVKKPAGFSFRPTQFTFLSLKTSEEGWDTRPMSIATSPTRSNLEYAVRTSDSPFKQAFTSLEAGDIVALQGPFGRFVLREDRPAVLVAGGVGITPLKGMAEYASDNALQIPVRLIYSNRTEEEIAYREELAELERRNPRFKVLHTLTGVGASTTKGWNGRAGRIDARVLREVARALEEPVYYVCGSKEMVTGIADLLTQSGVGASDIMEEVFRGYG
jgi:glycine betaine catabolism B